MTSTRKRNRIPRTCFYCRQKKIKCDKKKPHCTSCIKNNTTAYCHYKQDKQLLKDTWSDDVVDAASVTDSSATPEESKFKNVKSLVVKNNKLASCCGTSYMFMVLNDGYQMGLFYDKFSREFNEFHAKGLGNDEGGTVSFYENALVPPLPILPNAVWCKFLFNRFFDLCELFLPFLERSMLSSKADILFDGQPLTPQRINQNPFSACILLIVLRFGYLTMEKNHQVHTTMKDIDTLVYVKFAEKLLLSPYTTHCASKLQALLLLRVYQIYGPEDPGTLVASSLVVSIICQTAKDIGIMKDIQELGFTSDRDQSLWEVLRIYVLFHDAYNAFLVGRELIFYGTDILLNDLTPQNIETKGKEYRETVAGLFVISELTKLLRKTVLAFNHGPKPLAVLESVNTSCDQLLSTLATPQASQILISFKMITFHVSITVQYLLYLATGQEDYIFTCLKSCCYIMATTNEYIRTPRTYVVPGLEGLIFHPLILPLNNTVLILGGLIPRIWLKNLLITPALKASLGLDVTATSDDVTDNIYKMVKLVHVTMMGRTVNFFFSYHLVLVTKMIMDFYEKRVSQPQGPDTSVSGDILLQEVEEFWSHDIDFNTSYVNYLENLTLKSDPFLNPEIAYPQY